MNPVPGFASAAAALRGAGDSNMDTDMDVDRSMSIEPTGPMYIIDGSGESAVHIPDLSTTEYSVKIGLTLYKVQQNIYLLDFQKMTGDAFSFMTLCANIITELKTLSAASRQALQQAMLAQQQQQPPGGQPPPH
jgi:hypothetical protein